MLSEQERGSDDALWDEPKRKMNESFMWEANAWLGEHGRRDDDGADIGPEDSVSATYARKADGGDQRSSPPPRGAAWRRRLRYTLDRRLLKKSTPEKVRKPIWLKDEKNGENKRKREPSKAN